MTDQRELDEFKDMVQRGQRHPRGPQPLADVLSRLVSRRGYAQIQANVALQELWQAVVVGRLATESRACQVQRGTLEVLVRNSAVLQELTFQTQPILKRIGEKAPQFKIKKLRFRVGDLE